MADSPTGDGNSQVPTALDLLTDKPRPPVQSFRGAHVGLQLSADLTRKLREMSRREGATLYMVLLAAFKVLLSRYTGQQDIVVGTAIAGRTRPELEPLIGFFINTLVLRTDLSSDPTFAELVGRVRRVFLEAHAYQDVPFERLVEHVQSERDVSRSPPLFQVMFVLQNAPMSALGISETGLKSLDLESDTAKFDLTLAVEEEGENIVGKFVYCTDLFEAETIRRMVDHFRLLLEGVAGSACARISDLEFANRGGAPSVTR